MSATSATTGDARRLVEAVQAELRGRLGAMRSADFVETHRNTSATHGGAQLQYVTLQQTINGVPIDATYLHVGIRFGQAGAQLVSSSYRLFEHATVDTTPAIARDAAVSIAQQSLRQRTVTAPTAGALVVRRIDDHLQLAWRFAFPGSYRDVFVIASGVQRGRAISIDRRIYETTGTVTGPVVRGGAPGGAGVVEIAPFSNVQVSGGVAQSTSGSTGAYAIEVPDGTTVSATLRGKASLIDDAIGMPLTASGTAIAGGITDLAFSASGEFGLAQLTSYLFVDQVRSFLEQNGLDPALFGAPLLTRTNLDETCNAFYDPGDRSINFFRSGGGCNNSAIDTVIAHEYGHFVDDFNGGILDGGLSEGWGDLLGCLWSQQSLLGFDLFPGEALRNCQNDYAFPPGGFDEPHELGQAWAGFGWDVRQNLIAQLGAVDGEALARALILPSFQSNATDIPDAVREVFLRDDDDGTLSNLTPHWDALIAAATHHALQFTVETDSTPPSPVTTLQIASVLPGEVQVQWTATGDDGTTGTAASYELRWSTTPITADNFGAATRIPTSAPRSSGSLETVLFVVPPRTPVFVALIVADNEGNESTLSNVVSATTPDGEEVYGETFEGDTSGWTATGLWHVTSRRAADGSHAFWYGQESTGNYSTGLSSAGTLVSPIVDLASANSPVLVYDQFVDIEADPIFDLAQVTITDADDPSHSVTLNKNVAFTTIFVSRVIPLTEFTGKRITITFGFDTIDSVLNSTEGWFIDRLRVIGFADCAHDVCAPGGPLATTCSTCVAQVCAVDSACCDSAWSATCVAEAQQICGNTCATCGNGVCEPGETQAGCPADCTPACTHDVCEPGIPLEPVCDTCATAVCDADPFCCEVFWDRVCVDESEALCGKFCDACAHDVCSAGEPLDARCDTCAGTVCAADPYCCTTGWDSRCVQEAADGCGLTCTVCSHSLCAQGTALETSCDPCVTSVCAADPYCCNNTWDQRCVDEAQTTCGLSCVTERSVSAPDQRPDRQSRP